MKIAISDGEISKSLAVGWDFSPIRKVSHKDLGEGGGGGSPHLVGATKQHQMRGQKGNIGV